MLRFILRPLLFVALVWNGSFSGVASELSVRDRRHGENASEKQVEHTASSDEQEVAKTGNSIVEIRMPGVRTTKEDEYLCYGWAVPNEELYIVGYKPLTDASNVHHMLVFGCEELSRENYWRDCFSACPGNGGIVYAWAQNAPALKLPQDVGFRIGANTKYKYITIQVHYRMPTKAEDGEDHAGVELTLTKDWQKYIGGIYLMMTGTIIPAHASKVHADMSCLYEGDEVMYPFAFRTHAHTLGKVITGYHVNDTWHLYAKGNPQWPQAFYPTVNKVILKKGDKLVARCTYDASNRSTDTHMGFSHDDEMCNLYVMYYTANGGRSFFTCASDELPELSKQMPAGSDVPLPPNPLLDEMAHGHAHQGISNTPDWPKVLDSDKVTIGQIAGIATDSKGHLHIFHRGVRTWDFESFGAGNTFLQKNLGPIQDKTLLEFDALSGRILQQWGENIFYMCHGLTIDSKDNIWVTDVALHQVMKFSLGNNKPEMVLGVKFQPGSDSNHFCKPTDVAVLSTGEFFVSDGYCNSRIVKFSRDGKFLMQFGRASPINSENAPSGALLVPHSITVDEGRRQVWVADRENARLQCFDFNGTVLHVWQYQQFNPKVFAVTYNAATGNLYAVNGPADLAYPNIALFGSIWDPDSGRLINTWGPKNQVFHYPHDVAVSQDGRYIYVSEIGPNRVWQFRDYSVTTEESNGGVDVVHKGHSSEIPDVPHQSIKKSGVSSAVQSTPGTPATAARFWWRPDGKLDVVAVSLTIAAVCTIPLVVSVLGIICVRQCRHRTSGYSRLNIGGVSWSPGVPMRGMKPLVTQTREYKDNPDSDDSDIEEFNNTRISHLTANGRQNPNKPTLST